MYSPLVIGVAEYFDIREFYHMSFREAVFKHFISFWNIMCFFGNVVEGRKYFDISLIVNISFHRLCFKYDNFILVKVLLDNLCILIYKSHHCKLVFISVKWFYNIKGGIFKKLRIFIDSLSSCDISKIFFIGVIFHSDLQNLLWHEIYKIYHYIVKLRFIDVVKNFLVDVKHRTSLIIVSRIGEVIFGA